MLLFAGLMGLMAAGTVTMVDFNRTTETDADEDENQEDQATLLLAEQMRADLASLDPMAPYSSSSPNDTTTEMDQTQLLMDNFQPEQNSHEAVETATHEAEQTAVASDMEALPDDTLFSDFDPDEDGLMVVWDDTDGDAPEFDLVPSDADADVTELRAGDEVIARVPSDSGFGPEHVVIIPQSAAATLGWAEV